MSDSIDCCGCDGRGQVFLDICRELRWMFVSIGAFAVLVLMPIFAILQSVDGGAYSTHEYKYVWLVSVAFISGIPPTVVLIVTCALLAIITNFFILRIDTKEEVTDSVMGLGESSVWQAPSLRKSMRLVSLVTARERGSIHEANNPMMGLSSLGADDGGCGARGSEHNPALPIATSGVGNSECHSVALSSSLRPEQGLRLSDVLTGARGSHPHPQSQSRARGSSVSVSEGRSSEIEMRLSHSSLGCGEDRKSQGGPPSDMSDSMISRALLPAVPEDGTGSAAGDVVTGEQGSHTFPIKRWSSINMLGNSSNSPFTHSKTDQHTEKDVLRATGGHGYEGRSRSSNSKGTSESSASSCSVAALRTYTLLCVVVPLANAAVVVGMNAFYLWVVLTQSSAYLGLINILLAIFNTTWNTFIIPAAVRAVPTHKPLFVTKIITLSLMFCTSFVLVPIAVAAFGDTNCFNEYIMPPPHLITT